MKIEAMLATWCAILDQRRDLTAEELEKYVNFVAVARATSAAALKGRGFTPSDVLEAIAWRDAKVAEADARGEARKIVTVAGEDVAPAMSPEDPVVAARLTAEDAFWAARLDEVLATRTKDSPPVLLSDEEAARYRHFAATRHAVRIAQADARPGSRFTSADLVQGTFLCQQNAARPLPSGRNLWRPTNCGANTSSARGRGRALQETSFSRSHSRSRTSPSMVATSTRSSGRWPGE